MAGACEVAIADREIVARKSGLRPWSEPRCVASVLSSPVRRRPPLLGAEKISDHDQYQAAEADENLRGESDIRRHLPGISSQCVRQGVPSGDGHVYAIQDVAEAAQADQRPRDHQESRKGPRPVNWVRVKVDDVVALVDVDGPISEIHAVCVGQRHELLDLGVGKGVGGALSGVTHPALEGNRAHLRVADERGEDLLALFVPLQPTANGPPLLLVVLGRAAHRGHRLTEPLTVPMLTCLLIRVSPKNRLTTLAPASSLLASLTRFSRTARNAGSCAALASTAAARASIPGPSAGSFWTAWSTPSARRSPVKRSRTVAYSRLAPVQAPLPASSLAASMKLRAISAVTDIAKAASSTSGSRAGPQCSLGRAI